MVCLDSFFCDPSSQVPGDFGFPATPRTHGLLPRAACTSLSHRALCWLPALPILSAKAAPSSAWPLAPALGSLNDIGLGRWTGTVGVRVLCATGEAPASDTSLFGDCWVGGHRTFPLLTSGKPSTLHSWPQNRRVGPTGCWSQEWRDHRQGTQQRRVPWPCLLGCRWLDEGSQQHCPL